MGKMIIDKGKMNIIIKGSYARFRAKERENKSRSTTILDIIKIIKKELKENAD